MVAEKVGNFGEGTIRSSPGVMKAVVKVDVDFGGMKAVKARLKWRELGFSRDTENPSTLS